jgi:chromate reductase, NAD(P)H dehydrogenase (quinone)
MAEPARILAIAGSLREGSFNRKLLKVATTLAERSGATVETVDLKVLGLPVYDGDIEETQGLPGAANALRDRIAWSQGLLVCTPEYNHSIPGGLKNAIDWASRPPNQPFNGKVVAMMGASTSGFGTVRAQMHLREVFTTLGMYLIPNALLLSRAQDAFDERGELKDERKLKIAQSVVNDLIDKAGRLGGSAR